MKYILMVVLLCSIVQVRADVITGNKLLDACTNTEVVMKEQTDDPIVQGKAALCIGFVKGVTDAHTTFVDWEYMKPNWCLPPDVVAGQPVRTVTKYMQEHPQYLHRTASDLVAIALYLAFPC